MNTKQLVRLGCVAAVAMVGCSVCIVSAEAKSISVNFHTGFNTLAPTDSAGATPTKGWNNIIANGNIENVFNGLFDENGVITSVDLRAYGRGANTPELVTTAGNPNATMMTGAGITSIRPDSGSEGQVAAQVQLTNVLSELGGAYDVYVYYGTGWSCTVAGCFMGGSGSAIVSSGEYTFSSVGFDPARDDVPTTTVLDTKGYATMHGTNAGLGSTPTWDDGTGFIQSTGQAVNQKGNYVKFEGVTAADLVITMNPNSVGYQWNQNSIVGVQVIGQATVPEPSSIALAGLGLLSLVGYSLRRRRK